MKRPMGLRRRLGTAGSLLLLIVVLAGWQLFGDRLDEPWGPLANGGEWVDASFTRCGTGRSAACVVDGDTFRLGQRRVRIIGIDAPEIGEHARCPAEAKAAEMAAQRLRVLLSEGRFELVARRSDQTDQYGRELRSVRRTMADGTVRSVGEQMVEAGLVRRYQGGKRSWCA